MARAFHIKIIHIDILWKKRNRESPFFVILPDNKRRKCHIKLFRGEKTQNAHGNMARVFHIQIIRVDILWKKRNRESPFFVIFHD